MRFIQIFIHIQGVFTQGSEVYPGEYPEASPPNNTGLSVFSPRSAMDGRPIYLSRQTAAATLNFETLYQ